MFRPKPIEWVPIVTLFVGILVAVIYYLQLTAMQDQLSEMKKGTRPWIKVTHTIDKPLTFDKPRQEGTMAVMDLNTVYENVGASVALNVGGWENLYPIESNFSIEQARREQTKWCDANRHPDPKSLSGSIIFPKTTSLTPFTVGVGMDEIKRVINANPSFGGRLGFVLVGCVYYRASGESAEMPTHQTRFIYLLGYQAGETTATFVEPRGVANQLGLVEFPDGQTAD